MTGIGRIRRYHWCRAAIACLLALGVPILVTEAKRSQYSAAGDFTPYLSKAIKMAECRAKVANLLAPFLLENYDVPAALQSERRAPVEPHTCRPDDTPVVRPQLRSPPAVA